MIHSVTAAARVSSRAPRPFTHGRTPATPTRRWFWAGRFTALTTEVKLPFPPVPGAAAYGLVLAGGAR